MRTATIREFGGGWNVIDAPAALATRFASVLQNWYRKLDGSQSIRYGTKYKANIALGNLADTFLGTFYIANAGTEQFGDGVVNGKNIGFKFRATTAGALSDVTIEITAVGTAGNFHAELWSDSPGSPSAQIGVDSASVNIASTGNITFTWATKSNLILNTDYWIVIIDEGTTADVTGRTVANQGGFIASGKHDTITSITDNQLGSSLDWRLRVNVERPIAGNILDIKYFNGQNLCVTVNGEIAGVTGADVVSRIWDESVARQEVGSPVGWSTGLTIATFTEIKGSLVICNGIDKPLEIQSNFDPRYLQDLATGSNTNVPIGKYCTTVADYLCIAGVAADPNTVYIAAKGTVAVFPGDPDPNDSVALDVGAYAPEENEIIRAISSFRNYLFVHFFSATVQIVLGEYNAAGDHVPRIADTLPKFGAVSHRAIVPVVNDLLFNDVSGVNTVKRNVLSNAIEPDRLSLLIAPEYQKQVALLSQTDMGLDIFAVNDRLSGHYMLFVPDGTMQRCFVLTFNERMKIKAWSEFVDWNWIAATSTALGRVFFARDTRLYQYGNEAYNEEFAADFLDEYDEAWANNTAYSVGDRVLDEIKDEVFICLVAHTSAVSGTFEADRTANPTLWEEYEGEDINFDWEFPWTDANSRARLKRLANIFLDTQGTSQFDVDVFVDGIYKDEVAAYDPALTFGFTAGDSPGYGGGDQPYGGGRRTSDERLWSHPVKFKIMKPRIHGSTKKPLRIVTLGFLFAEGKYGR
ncbi:MAG: hypothetical protein MN733_03490 [Nitrososphaera sp.]|nr:hypothetical protein [Nitrososphaera sp.]